jgi:hypothetical protein
MESTDLRLSSDRMLRVVADRQDCLLKMMVVVLITMSTMVRITLKMRLVEMKKTTLVIKTTKAIVRTPSRQIQQLHTNNYNQQQQQQQQATATTVTTIPSHNQGHQPS